jgi:hypothetical protein
MAVKRRRNEDFEAADLVTELPSAYPTRGEPLVGPSDSSDSPSDLIGTGLEGSSDRQGTGERADVGDTGAAPAGSDLLPDRIVGEAAAGLGGGLDQAEEAQLGITDEEIEAAEKRAAGED